MLEITGDDIAKLNDTDLRRLVGRLCESELHSRGLSTSAVTWSGEQDSPDGGTDVRVTIVDGNPPGGFMPRANIVFQVKKTAYAPAAIGKEMRPKGRLRNSIKQLIAARGAYIIVSSGSNLSDPAYTRRVEAMQSAVARHAGHKHFEVDFLDRNRIATWTRLHPGLVIWVRARIAREIWGWKSFRSWTPLSAGLVDEFMLDDEVRLHGGSTVSEGMKVAQGIDVLRSILRRAQGVVRLVGLSGVGKTRLVQSLFDASVGTNHLNPASAIYTDIGDNP